MMARSTSTGRSHSCGEASTVRSYAPCASTTPSPANAARLIPCLSRYPCARATEWVRAKTSHKLTLILFSRSDVEIDAGARPGDPSVTDQYVSHMADTAREWTETPGAPRSADPSLVVNVDSFGRRYQDHFMTVVQGDTVMHRDPARLTGALRSHL